MLRVCLRDVHLAGGLPDCGAVTSRAIGETWRARGHHDVAVAAAADERRVVFVGSGRGAKAVAELAEHLTAHGCPPQQICQVGIDLSAAPIKGLASTCRRRKSHSTRSTSSRVPARRWTRRAAWGSAAIASGVLSSRACAGTCSRTWAASSPKRARRYTC